MIYKIPQGEKASLLFEGWQETMIWSCLQNVMGSLYGNDAERPVSAMIQLGDFCFFGGRPDRELAVYRPEGSRQDFRILVPQNRDWEEMIERQYGAGAKKTLRYAIKKEPAVFDTEKLRKAAEGLPEGYTLKMMDRELFHRCGEIRWCRDWVAQYDTYERYEKYGMGAVILKDGEPVAGASSYSGYEGGIEIEIDTRQDFRRKGLGYVCGAKLVLECLNRGWYPSWDAQNKGSVALAEKLGYHFSHEYTVYEVCRR